MWISLIDKAIMTSQIYILLLGIVFLFCSVNKKGAMGDTLLFMAVGFITFFNFIYGVKFFTGVENPLEFLVSKGSLLYWISALISGLLVAVLPYSLVSLGIFSLGKTTTSAEKGPQ